MGRAYRIYVKDLYGLLKVYDIEAELVPINYKKTLAPLVDWSYEPKEGDVLIIVHTINGIGVGFRLKRVARKQRADQTD